MYSSKTSWVGPLKIPGELEIGGSGVTLKAELLDPANWKLPDNFNPDQAFLDYEKTGKDIQVRFFQPGDRLTPLGMTGSKKVKSLFIDDKIPKNDRSRIPILTTARDDIIWVYGNRIGNRYRVTPETRTILFIKGLH